MKLYFVNWHTVWAAGKASDAVLAYREQGRRKLKRLEEHGVTNPVLSDAIVDVCRLSEKEIVRLTVGGQNIMEFAQERVQRTKKFPCLIAVWKKAPE